MTDTGIFKFISTILADVEFKKYHLTIFLIFSIMFVILGLLKFEIGKEAYFYTLSTIAQSLAGLIGIIGAFFVFRLEKLTDQRQDNLNLLDKKINNFKSSGAIKNLKNKNIKLYYILENPSNSDLEELWIQICPVIEEINKTDELNDLNIKEVCDDLKKIDNKVKQIHNGFNRPALFGLGAILASIIILPFGWIQIPYAYENNTSYNLLKMFLIGIIISLAILSIFEILFFFSNIFKPIRDRIQ